MTLGKKIVPPGWGGDIKIFTLKFQRKVKMVDIMKDFTRQIKNEVIADWYNFTKCNHTRDSKRTEAQKAQARQDKVNFYTKKWEAYLGQTETKAQKDMCNRILNNIGNYKF